MYDDDDLESLWIPMLDDEENMRLAKEYLVELLIAQEEENEKRKAASDN